MKMGQKRRMASDDEKMHADWKRQKQCPDEK